MAVCWCDVGRGGSSADVGWRGQGEGDRRGVGADMGEVAWDP